MSDSKEERYANISNLIDNFDLSNDGFFQHRVYGKIVNIQGLYYYNFQLDDFLFFLDKRIGDSILKNYGYRPNIISNFYKKYMYALKEHLNHSSIAID